MSSETIINRTPDSFGQAVERERLAAEVSASDASEKPQTDEEYYLSRLGPITIPIPTEFTPLHQVGGDGMAEPSTGKSLGRELNVGSDPKYSTQAAVNTQSWPTSTSGANESQVETGIRSAIGVKPYIDPLAEHKDPSDVSELLKEFLEHSTAADLAKFKKDVIAAFKHLGLDVRKHFGV